jgi:hypothetical protein
VPNLEFATLTGPAASRTSNSKSTLESISSSVAYDSEIRSEASIDMCGEFRNRDTSGMPEFEGAERTSR